MPHIWSPDDEVRCSPDPVDWTVHHTIWSFQSSSGITLYAYRRLRLPESSTRRTAENNGGAKSNECKEDFFRNLLQCKLFEGALNYRNVRRHPYQRKQQCCGFYEICIQALASGRGARSLNGRKDVEVTGSAFAG